MPKVYLDKTFNSTNMVSIEADLYTNDFEIYFFEEVNNETVKDLHISLTKLNRIDPKREITIYINSPGGSVTSGLIIYDLIENISNPIKTVCTGMAASMGSVLFAAGDKRIIYKHAQVMIHDPLISQTGGSALAIQETAISLMKTREAMADILAKACHKTREEVLEKTSRDTYFDAKQAVEFGLADEIMGEE